MRVLRARLLARQQEEIAAAASDQRKTQIRTMDRSERIRTYNFPENRIADHRTGYKAYNLDQVMNGALQPVIDSCIQADEESRLAELADTPQ
jgi:peptide chain release factor 1